MMSRSPPKLDGNNLVRWAVETTDYLNDLKIEAQRRNVVKLEHMTGSEKAIEDGVVMYDPVIGKPVFSKSGAWYTFDGVAV